MAMYWSAWYAVTKYHRLGSLNISSLLSHNYGSQKSQVKVQKGPFLVRVLSWACKHQHVC